jgi:YVTN family beta-propeller protein
MVVSRMSVRAAMVAVLLMSGSIGAAGAADTSAGGLLLIANKGDRALGLIDPSAGRQIASVPEGGITGHEVIASPDGKTAYVPIYGNSGVGKPGTDGTKIVAIDLASQKVVRELDFGRGLRPHCPLFGPKDGLLYVTTEIENSISVIDPATFKVVGTVPTGQPESHMLAITRDGRRGYTANVGPGTVSALDLEHRKTLAVIPISKMTQRISLSVDDARAFTADQTSPRLAVIDTATNKVSDWISMPGVGYGTAPTPDGKWLIVALPQANKVAVVNLATLKVDRTIDVPPAPQEVLVRPDGTVAYVSCDASGTVAVIRISDWTMQGTIAAGKGADGLAWASH